MTNNRLTALPNRERFFFWTSEPSPEVFVYDFYG